MVRSSIIRIAFLLLLALGSAQADFVDNLSNSQKYLTQGQYRLALDEAYQAQKEAESTQEQARTEGIIGQILLILKQYNGAEKALLKAFELSNDLPLEKAAYANNLGILYTAQQKPTEAEKYFKQALLTAGVNASLVLNIKLNQLRNKPETASPALLNNLWEEIEKLPTPLEKISNAVSFAAIADASKGNENSNLAIKALEQARADSQKINDIRLRVEVLNVLAEKYEKRKQDDQALKFSEEATALQTTEDLQDLLYELEWRKGRIYQKQGKDELALVAFGKAVEDVQAIRIDIPIEYHDGKSSFRETLEPIYLGYAYQLLKKAGAQQGDIKQRTLLLARQTVEQIKQTEMEDFFGGRCLIEGLQRNELNNIETGVATVYPIMLPDRLELLVGIGGTIHQYTIPVTDKQLKSSAHKLAVKLRNMDDNYAQESKKLYQWMIAPIEQDLDAAKIKTLVIVPDSVLRLVPFSALNNGQHYVIEKYSVAVSPGMSLMGAGGTTTNRTNQTLLAGLSRPGSVVEKLPPQVVMSILSPDEEQSSTQRSLPHTRSLGDCDLRSIDAEPANDVVTRDVELLLRKPGAVEKLQDQLSLPGVEEELNTVKKSLKNTTLLNNTFTVEAFHKAASTQAFEIIHVASHGIFTSDAETSFIMAYDNVLKINDLENLLKGDKPGKTIELLTFSACETAEGDDRAPMGFAGIALKAHAHSAIGSLWPISDTAASILMGNFYKNLSQSASKAEALRQAQLELIKSKDMSHPFFWSPFILVGNWI